MTTTNISSTDLRQFSTRLFESIGMPAATDDADVAAASLVESDLRGIYSHGVVRLQPPYMEEMRDGYTNPTPDIKVVRNSAAHALLDSDRGQGQVVSHRAMSLAIDKARAATSNGSRLTAAPFGGIEAAQGNMPMSYAIPNGDGDPVLLDMATGAAAMGKVMMASIRGDSIPTGWAIDAEGRDTTDPDSVTAILPAGGPKGYGIGVVLDILAGTLTGSLPSAIKGLDPEIAGKGNQSGHFFMAINIEGFVPVEEFADTMREHSRTLHAVKPRPGFDGVYLPGELEWKNKAERLAILQEMSHPFSVPITW
jgi:LDH2 family malate/lactate/ureidoglycolate dehydrogenase